MEVRVAHSPDADDHFLFWAMKRGILDCGNLIFRFTTLDTEELNEAAQRQEFDVVAISLACLPRISENYLLLSSGASVGRNYGPKLIIQGERKQSETDALAALANGTVGIPGDTTTAALLLQKLLPGVKTLCIPLSPYRGVFDALRAGTVDAAVVIHEGQLAFRDFDCSLLLDLGEWWFTSTGLPIPVGVNVVHRRMGAALPKISSLLKESVRIALQRVDEIIPELLEIDAAQGGKLKEGSEIRKYLSLYANEDSLELPQDALLGIERLLKSTQNPDFRVEIV